MLYLQEPIMLSVGKYVGINIEHYGGEIKL
jgi:hypothetical protein